MTDQDILRENEENGEPVCGETQFDAECNIEKALDVLGGKWTFLIIRDLFAGKKRFGELLKSLHGVSPKTLAGRLRELEEKGVLTRNAYATIPPTVEYELTEKGHSLKPLIKEMKKWGKTWG